MAEAVVTVALQSLQDLVVHESRLLSGVADQIEEVSAELKRMQVFLKDADSRNHKDKSVRNWLREIRLLAYKVEDIVEKYAVEAASKRSGGMTKVLKRFGSIICEAKSLHNLGLEIAKVRRDISNITTSLQRYDIKGIGAGECSNENQWWGRQTYAHEVEEHFVGMEEDMQKLVSLVLDDEKSHRVISIWGMGGLGKTTLARKIYKHRDVQRCFERFAWACITQQGQIRTVLQDTLLQLAPGKIGEVKYMGDGELVRQLHHVQKSTKCLVVLDDFWRLNDWKSLVAAFPIAEGDSKILLTTRNQKIAEIGFPYAPKCLTINESWGLLKRIACSRTEVQDIKIELKLEHVGIEMVRKCGGLPLAISVLGGILNDKNSLTEWQMVNKYISSYLSKVEDDDQEGGAVAQVLSLSYNDLPYYLRPCFLYLGSFREDEMIDVDQLYQLWMAEGMVLSQHRRSDETLIEVAERYLDELVRRSMVQVRLSHSLIARSHDKCGLHDMMRDLCLEKGMEEEFIKIIDFQGVRQPFLNPPPPSNLACRLVIHMNDELLKGAAKEKGQQLRSLLCHNSNSKFLGKKIIWPQGIVNLEDSKSLRVLKFEGFEFQGKKSLGELQKLIHLRYLNVSSCKLDELPSSVAKLPFLHTLKVMVNSELKVPNDLCKMKQLRHLYLFTSGGRYTEKGKLRLHGLSELETLCRLDSTTDEISDIANLLNLRVLTARVCDHNSLRIIADHISMNGLKLKTIALWIDGSCDFVSSKAGPVLLRKVLMCGNLHHLRVSVKMSKFPRYEPSLLQNLVQLTLQENKIEEDPLKTLEMLPQLRILLLGPDAYMGKDMICHEWGFPQLKVLWLFKQYNLEHWRVEKGAMPKISSLMIWGCGKLEMIPEGLKFALSLEEVVIHEMSGKFYQRIKGIDGRKGDDYYKIQHVPSIFIDCPLQCNIEAACRNLCLDIIGGVDDYRDLIVETISNWQGM